LLSTYTYSLKSTCRFHARHVENFHDGCKCGCCSGGGLLRMNESAAAPAVPAADTLSFSSFLSSLQDVGVYLIIIPCYVSLHQTLRSSPPTTSPTVATTTPFYFPSVVSDIRFKALRTFTESSSHPPRPTHDLQLHLYFHFHPLYLSFLPARRGALCGIYLIIVPYHISLQTSAHRRQINVITPM
jgi:hypothetical protein